MNMVPKRLKNKNSFFTESRLQERAADAKVPKYWLVATDIIYKIRQGIYKPGERLESMRRLAENYQVGLQVIQLAAAGLQHLGYISSRANSGLFVSNPPAPKRGEHLGIFFSDYNPAEEGMLIYSLAQEMAKFNYTPILGSDYEDEDDFFSWVRRRNPDGVFFAGLVTETLLEKARSTGIPYVVVGNYDIAPEHPQVTIDTVQMFYKYMKKNLKRFAGKRIAFLFGKESGRSDRQCREATLRALRELTPDTIDESLLVHQPENDNDDSALYAILENPLVDVLVFRAFIPPAFIRYCCMFPQTRKPYIVYCGKDGGNFSAANFVNLFLDEPRYDHDCPKAMKVMMRELEKNHADAFCISNAHSGRIHGDENETKP